MSETVSIKQFLLFYGVLISIKATYKFESIPEIIYFNISSRIHIKFQLCCTGPSIISKIRKFKPLAIFCSCTNLFVLSLVRNPKDSFFHDKSHLFHACANNKGAEQHVQARGLLYLASVNCNTRILLKSYHKFQASSRLATGLSLT